MLQSICNWAWMSEEVDEGDKLDRRRVAFLLDCRHPGPKHIQLDLDVVAFLLDCRQLGSGGVAFLLDCRQLGPGGVAFLLDSRQLRHSIRRTLGRPTLVFIDDFIFFV